VWRPPSSGLFPALLLFVWVHRGVRSWPCRVVGRGWLTAVWRARGACYAKCLAYRERVTAPEVSRDRKKHLGNVPHDASFSSIGSFPSHQPLNSPNEFSEPSIGLLPR